MDFSSALPDRVYVDAMLRAQTLFWQGDQLRSLALFDKERPQTDRVFADLLDHVGSSPAHDHLFVTLVFATSVFAPLRYRIDDRIASLEHALAISQRLGLPAHDIRTRSELADLYCVSGCHHEAGKLLQTCSPSSPKEKQRILASLGILWYFQGDMEQAISYFRQALHIVTARNDMWEKARILGNVGACFLHAEEHEQAHMYTEQAFLVSSTLNNITHAAHMLNNSGATYLSLKQYDQASLCLLSAMKFFCQTNDLGAQALVLGNLATLEFLVDNQDAATEYNTLAKEYALWAGDVRTTTAQSANATVFRDLAYDSHVTLHAFVR